MAGSGNPQAIFLLGGRRLFLLMASMKTRANWLLIPTMALGLGACKKDETAKTPEAQQSAATRPEETVPVPKSEPLPPAVSAEERAAKLGFAKHLPQDTEVLLSFYNGTKTAERVKASKLWKLTRELTGMGGMGMGMGEDDDEMAAAEMEAPPAGQDAGVVADPATGDGPGDAVQTEPAAGAAEPPAPAPADAEAPGEDPAAAEPAGPSILFGSEFTIAMGKSTGDQLGNLMTVNRRLTYFQMRGLARALAGGMKSGDLGDLSSQLVAGYNEETMKDFIKDPESGVNSIEKAKMPPLYLAFRVAEADRVGAAQQVAAMVENLNMAGEMVAPVKIEAGGASFEGAQLLGAKISEMMAADRSDMDEEIGAEAGDKLLAAVAKKDLFVVSGVVGDYVLLFIGGSKDDLKLAESPAQSILGASTLSFGDSYLSKDLAALVYGQKELLDQLIDSAGGMSDITDGLRDGLAGSEGLGDTRDLEALFKIVGEREAALRKLSGIESSGTVAFFEDGLKIEGYGGIDNGAVDWKSPNKLASLGKSEDVLLFANVTVDAAYDEKCRAYGEALLETAYATAMKFSEVPGEGGELGQFKEMAKMFDTKFRPDLTALWGAFGDLHGSLGHERAVVVDLKGTSPAVPGIPQVVVDKAKVPRISFVAPVTDRAKLAGSWDKMNATLTGSLAKISEMTGQDIPMQKPLSSEKNGSVTWFFPMPFFTDDFLPSVTVADKWFVASTSKNQALDLINQANIGTETRNGFWFSMNFRSLENYANETLKLVDENAEALMGQPLGDEEKKVVKSSIEVLSECDKLTAHSRREGAVLRSSVHFKTR